MLSTPSSPPTTHRIRLPLWKRGGVVASLMVGSLSSGLGSRLSVVPPIAAQTPSPLSPTAPPSSPLGAVPVVSAAFPDPPQPEDWTHLPWPEACQGAVARLLNDQMVFAVSHDTGRAGLDQPLPLAVTTVTEDCLRHFVIATLPAFEVPVVRQLATASGTESVVRAVVARQLATLAGAPVRRRAAVLETVVDELTRDHRTPAKTQLARTFMMQGDALGTEALVERLAMHSAMDAPRGAYDPDAILAFGRERLTLLQQVSQVPPGTLTVEEKKGLLEDLIWTQKGQEEMEKLQTWLTSGSQTTFQRWVAAYRGNAVSPNPLMGALAPQVSGTYWFNTPRPGGAPTVPVPGKVNLIVFVDQPETPLPSNGEQAMLQHLHHVFPELQITLVTKTTGSFFGRVLVDHPDQEATLIHQFFTDSLHLPGLLVVDSGTYQRLPTGQINQLEWANRRNYHSYVSGFLIDPRGRVVREGVLGDSDRWPEEDYFIRHVQAMAPALTPTPATAAAGTRKQ